MELKYLVHTHYASYQKWLEIVPTCSFEHYCNYNTDAGDLASYLCLLHKQVLDAIEHEAQGDANALQALLAQALDPLPDPNNPDNHADIGVARYGLTVFGDPTAAIG